MRRLFAALLVLGLMAAPLLASDVTTPEATAPAAKAGALLQAGQLAEARDAYKALAQADPDNTEAAQQAALLTQVLDLQTFLRTEDPSPSWERAAVVLHAWYHQTGLAKQALTHDRAVHAKADTATTAALVAETLLALDQNTEAASFVEGLRQAQKDDQVQVYGNIALARLGRTDEVRDAVRIYGTPETTEPGLLFDVARLQTLLGERDAALATLTAAFENCPPRALDGLKLLAGANVDLAPLRGNDAFQKVLATPSKMSGCGGCATGCGSCPSESKGDCDDCPSKGSCDSCPMSGDAAADAPKGCCGQCDGDCEKCPCNQGGCADCPSKGECDGCPKQADGAADAPKGCCGQCDGDCEKSPCNQGGCDDCPSKGQCDGCPKQAAGAADAPRSAEPATADEPATKSGCCGSCR